VIPTPRGISLDHLRQCLAAHIGKHLVAKPTQGSGFVLFLDNVDDHKLKKLFRATRYDHFYSYRETQYFGQSSKIIVEENIGDGTDLPDYKFFCTRGSILFVQVDLDRFTDHRRVLLMPPNFEPSDKLQLGAFEIPISWQKPDSFDEMVRITRQLSRPFDFVRVDLYSTAKGIFLGEFTFTPGAGMEPFSDSTFSKILLQRIMRGDHCQAAVTG
jgi:TupA-like ATPgrasp